MNQNKKKRKEKKEIAQLYTHECLQFWFASTGTGEKRGLSRQRNAIAASDCMHAQTHMIEVAE